MSRLVVLCGKMVVDLDRVNVVVGTTVHFVDGSCVGIGEKPAEELMWLLSKKREEHGKDGEA